MAASDSRSLGGAEVLFKHKLPASGPLYRAIDSFFSRMTFDWAVSRSSRDFASVQTWIAIGAGRVTLSRAVLIAGLWAVLCAGFELVRFRVPGRVEAGISVMFLCLGFTRGRLPICPTMIVGGIGQCAMARLFRRGFRRFRFLFRPHRRLDSLAHKRGFDPDPFGVIKAILPSFLHVSLLTLRYAAGSFLSFALDQGRLPGWLRGRRVPKVHFYVPGSCG